MQTVEIGGQAGETFCFGAWSFAFAAGLRDGRTYSMRVEAPKADGTMELLGEFSFNPYCNYWQYGIGMFTLAHDTDTVLVSLTYDYQEGRVGFDGVHLNRVMQ